MTIVLDGSAGITNDGGYTGDGVVFADTTPANTLVTTTGGNVGIGTSSPGRPLHVASSSTSYLARFQNSGSALALINFKDSTTGDFDVGVGASGASLVAYTGNLERARIDSSGNLLVGTTSSGGARTRIVGSSTEDYTGAFSVLNSNTTAAACVASFVTGTNSTATSNVLVRFGIDSYNLGSGQINANGANAAAFGSFSDARLKENIVDLPSQLENICALRPVEFDYIESEGGGHQLGFIAQDMQEVYPDAVGERGDGMLTVTGWDKTTARLVKAIQEQQAIITAQAAQIQQLREKVLEVEEGTSNMLVENTNNLYETITALTARVAALEGK